MGMMLVRRGPSGGSALCWRTWFLVQGASEITGRYSGDLRRRQGETTLKLLIPRVRWRSHTAPAGS